MSNSITLSLPVILFFVSAAIVLGYTISLFAGKHKTTQNSDADKASQPSAPVHNIRSLASLKDREKEIEEWKGRLKESEKATRLVSARSEELCLQYKKLEGKRDHLEKKIGKIEKDTNVLSMDPGKEDKLMMIR